MTDTVTSYATPEEVRLVVQRFESCDFGPDEFHHNDHLTVALCYLMESTEEEACAQMRSGLLRFLEHHGRLGAYHETITVFWIKLVKSFLDQADRSLSFVQLANDVVSCCGRPQLIDAYFSKDLLAMEEARRRWVEPDLKSMER